jgi:hypothetical protein
MHYQNIYCTNLNQTAELLRWNIAQKKYSTLNSVIFHKSLFRRLIISEDRTLSPISFVTRFHSRNVPHATDVFTVRYLTVDSVHSAFQTDNTGCRWRSSKRQGRAACKMDTSNRPTRSVGPSAAHTTSTAATRLLLVQVRNNVCLSERQTCGSLTWSLAIRSAFQIPRLQKLSVLYLKTPSIILLKFSFS